MKISPKWIARLLVLLFLGWLLYWGGVIAHMAFRDSDTCWLLAMGRWIIEHRALPMVDPFSTGVSTDATIVAGMPLVQYQWLTEILFYAVYRQTGLYGLLILVSFIVSITFICLPYLSLAKANSCKSGSFAIIASIAMLAAFCLYTRPQILSFLFLALLIYLYIPSKLSLAKISAPLVIATLAIILLWTNMHMFFPLGIMFITLVVVVRFIESRLIDKDNQFSHYYFVVPVLAMLPTLLNPWGVYIWPYVNRLRLHRSSNWVTEMSPVSLFDWHNSLTLFLLLSLAVYIFIYFYYRVFSLKKSGFLSPVLAICGLTMSLQHCKLVPVTALFLLAACVELISRQAPAKQIADESAVGLIARWRQFRVAVNDHLEKLLPRQSVCLAIILALVVLGALITAPRIPITLPQACPSLQPPFGAIEFLQQHRPAGKVYNDPQFGSMMIWYLPNPDVFYDTRFSQYVPERMLDSLHIKNCDPGWEKTWRQYSFDWAFIKPSIPLVKVLRKMGWQIIYEDETAVVLTKTNG